MLNKIKNILRRSEKYTKTDMVYLASNSFWLTSDQMIANVISFGLSIIYANLLNKEIYGTYRYFLSAYGLIALISIPGLYTSLTRSISRGFDGNLGLGFKQKLRWSLLGSLVAIVLAGYYYFKANQLLGTGFMMIAVALPLAESFALYVCLLEGKKLFKQEVIYNIIISSLSALAIIVAVYFYHNIYSLLVAYFTALIIPRFIFYKLSIKKYKSNNNIDPEMNDFTKKINAFQIFSNATQYIDKILLFTMLGAKELAIFSFAIALPDRIKSLFRVAGTISFPKFANKTEIEIKQSIRQKIPLYAGLILFIILIYFFTAPLIFKYLFPQYLESVRLTQIIALSSIYAVTYPIGAYLSAHKRVKELFTISSSSFILGLTSMLIFIPIYGIWGAVIGLGVNRLTNISTSFYYLYKA